MLLVLAGLMVAAGLVMPSAASGPPEGFRSLGGPAKPVRLVVPSLRIRAQILPIEVNQQAVLDPPEDPRDVGWWKRSARPGKASGQTVLTGHTVHTGGGVMDNLRKLHRGNVVRVVTPKGVMVYRTTRVVTWSKAELAKRSVSIFEQKRDRQPARADHLLGVDRQRVQGQRGRLRGAARRPHPGLTDPASPRSSQHPDGIGVRRAAAYIQNTQCR